MEFASDRFSLQPLERQRVADLMALIPPLPRGEALDVGCRDGHIAMSLAASFDRVTALDLQEPEIPHHKVVCVKGNITSLRFPDHTFDLVVCTEVLEHLPAQDVTRACQELIRVSASHILIGVPFHQDLRCGRTLCRRCGQRNPPWGHVNAFNERQLLSLFDGLEVERLSYVGQTKEITNPVSTYFMDLAGNPWGTYEQEEPCVSCGARLSAPPPPGIPQRILVKGASLLDRMQQRFVRPRGRWIHVLFHKRHSRGFPDESGDYA